MNTTPNLNEAASGGSSPAPCSPSSDTPETDAAWKAVSRTPDGMYDSRVPISEFAYAMSCHSRKMERERDHWKKKYIRQNKDLGCEMMDPNGTIWEHAANLEKTVKRYKMAISNCLEWANGHEYEWGARAINALAFLEAAMNPIPTNATAQAPKPAPQKS